MQWSAFLPMYLVQKEKGEKKKGILCERTVKLLSELMDMNQK